jgi:TolA-binding protein
MHRSSWIVVAIASLCFLASSPTTRAQDAKAAVALYRDASQLQNAGKFGEALKKWQQFVKDHGDDPAIGQAYQGLGTCSLETGAFEQAIDAFHLALKKLPEGESSNNLRWNLALAWQRRAEQSKNADHRQQLAAALQRVLADKNTPKERRALAGFYLARAELTLGKADQARKRFQELVDQSAEPAVVPAARLALANLAEDNRNWPDAAQRFADFLKHHPDHASVGEARLGLAEAYFRQSQWKEAEKVFAEIKEAGPGADYAHFRWAELARLRGDLAESAKRWRQFLDQRPASAYRARGLWLAGDTFDQLKDYPRAIETWELLLNEYPKEADRDLSVRLGWALLRDGKCDRGEIHFRAALVQRLPADQRAMALWGLARCATDLKKPDEAFRRYGEFVKNDEYGPSGDQALYQAVLAALTIGDSKTGATWAVRMVERFPKSVWTGNAQLQAARFLADHEDYAQAWQRSRSVLEFSAAELQAPALYLSGYCALKSRKFKEAIPYFEKLRDDHPRSDQAPVAMYSLGVAWESMGAGTLALSAYEDFLKLHPKHRLAGQAAKRVRILQPN